MVLKNNHDTVEIKRMFVAKQYRRSDFSKIILAELENRAIHAGFILAVLETIRHLYQQTVCTKKPVQNHS